MKVAEDRPSRQSRRRAAKRKVRVPQNARLVRFLLHPVGKALLIAIACVFIAGMGFFIHYYNVYSKMIDERLRGGPYSTTSRIFAAPTRNRRGRSTRPSPSDIAA